MKMEHHQAILMHSVLVLAGSVGIGATAAGVGFAVTVLMGGLLSVLNLYLTTRLMAMLLDASAAGANPAAAIGVLSGKLVVSLTVLATIVVLLGADMLPVAVGCLCVVGGIATHGFALWIENYGLEVA